jgi:alpha-galactosidase
MKTKVWLSLSLALFSVLLGHCTAAEQAQIALTPPMGWNTWYGFFCKVTDADVRAQADEMVKNGMKAAGYEYVNLDDCWQGQRDSNGAIRANKNFPDMKALGDYIHSKRLKFGIYTSPGPKTCAEYEGSYQHEEQDARTYAEWGVDFVKYDWCSADNVYKASEMVSAYSKMHDALVQTGRPMLFSLCQYGLEHVWTWGSSVGGNMWRTTGDLKFTYDRITLVGFQQDGLERFAGPGHWNDPDILLPGIGKMTDDENRSQMSLWCLIAAPLIAAADLRTVSPSTLAILTNPEVIAVDQDRLGLQGHRVTAQGPLEVWAKQLSDGSKAVGLFNRGEGSMPITAYFKDLGVGETAVVRDLWNRKDLETFKEAFTAEVPTHGVIMIRVK